MSKELFASYPSVDRFYKTSDNQYFIEKNYADAHARTLSNSDVEEVNRVDYDDPDQEREPAPAQEQEPASEEAPVKEEEPAPDQEQEPASEEAPVKEEEPVQEEAPVKKPKVSKSKKK